MGVSFIKFIIKVPKLSVFFQTIKLAKMTSKVVNNGICNANMTDTTSGICSTSFFVKNSVTTWHGMLDLFMALHMFCFGIS